MLVGHALMENHHGLLVESQVNQAMGTAERAMVPVLLDQAKERGCPRFDMARPLLLGCLAGHTRVTEFRNEALDGPTEG